MRNIQKKLNESYIVFIPVEAPYEKKTRIWHVRPVGDAMISLGFIKWFGRWRCYAFYPQPGSVFENHCLMDLAEFCKEKTDEWRAEKRRMRKDAADLLFNHCKRSFNENPSG